MISRRRIRWSIENSREWIGIGISSTAFFVCFNYSDDVLREMESLFQAQHKIIVALTVKETLDEQIAKKLV